MLLNATQIRKATGITYHNLKHYRTKGYIKGYKLEGGSVYYYKLKDLSKFKKTKWLPEKLQNISAIISSSN